MKISPSKQVQTLILVIALALSAINMYLILDLRQAVENAAHDLAYDYLIFQEDTMYKAKSQASGYVEFISADAAEVNAMKPAASPQRGRMSRRPHKNPRKCVSSPDNCNILVHATLAGAHG